MTDLLKTLIILGLMFFIFRYWFPKIGEEYSGCSEYEDMITESIKGTVIDKYIDNKNHNYKTIVLREAEESRKKVLTQGYASLYKQIQIGDSLKKNINEDFYIIKSKKRKNSKIVFRNLCKKR